MDAWIRTVDAIEAHGHLQQKIEQLIGGALASLIILNAARAL